MAELTPSKTYTLEDFVSMKIVDDMTYYNFSIVEVINGVKHLDTNLVEQYLDVLKSVCSKVQLSDAEYRRYKYYPDLLANDIYGSVQLDFIILLLNDTFDPKEFTKKILYLPSASILKNFLNTVYSKESGYIEQNRNVMNLSR
jgi:hypothetical protein